MEQVPLSRLHESSRASASARKRRPRTAGRPRGGATRPGAGRISLRLGRDRGRRNDRAPVSTRTGRHGIGLAACAGSGDRAPNAAGRRVTSAAGRRVSNTAGRHLASAAARHPASACGRRAIRRSRQRAHAAKRDASKRALGSAWSRCASDLFRAAAAPHPGNEGVDTDPRGRSVLAARDIADRASPGDADAPRGADHERRKR